MSILMLKSMKILVRGGSESVGRVTLYRTFFFIWVYLFFFNFWLDFVHQNLKYQDFE